MAAREYICDVVLLVCITTIWRSIYSVNSISRRALELEIAMMLHDKHEGLDKVIVKKSILYKIACKHVSKSVYVLYLHGK